MVFSKVFGNMYKGRGVEFNIDLSRWMFGLGWYKNEYIMIYILCLVILIKRAEILNKPT